MDAEKHHLVTYEGGGAAGLILESKEYAFMDGKLPLMRDEKPQASPEFIAK